MLSLQIQVGAWLSGEAQRIWHDLKSSLEQNSDNESARKNALLLLNQA